jgi:hypothetical protein
VSGLLQLKPRVVLVLDDRLRRHEDQSHLPPSPSPSPSLRLGTATGVVLVAGGVALYLRFVKGWRLSDLMYVTRSSLTSMSESMKSGAAAGSEWGKGPWGWGAARVRVCRAAPDHHRHHHSTHWQ